MITEQRCRELITEYPDREVGGDMAPAGRHEFLNAELTHVFDVDGERLMTFVDGRRGYVYCPRTDKAYSYPTCTARQIVAALDAGLTRTHEPEDADRPAMVSK